MAQSSAERMRRLRARRWAKLLEMLGGKCAECGATERLEIDHLYQRTWNSSKTYSAQRLRIQIAEAEAGKVQLLCRTCNARKGRPAEEDPYF